MRVTSPQYHLIGFRAFSAGILVVGLTVAILAFTPSLEGLAISPSISEGQVRELVSDQLRFTFAMLGVKLVITLALVVGLFHYARIIKRSGLFPPPGTWAVRGQKVYTDPHAFVVSILLRLAGVMGLLMIAAALYLAYYYEEIVVSLYLSVVRSTGG